MDFCQDIRDAKKCYAGMATDYSVALTYGRGSEEKFFDLLRLGIYIKTLERNIPIKKKVYENISIQGTTVDFSSLKKQNNNLILDVEPTKTCSIIEVSPCLSDDEICEIIESAKILCCECNC